MAELTIKEVEKKLTDIEGLLATANTQLAETKKRADLAEAVIKLNAETREIFDAFSKEDQNKFLAGDEGVRKGMLEEATKGKKKKAEDEEEPDEDEMMEKRLDEAVEKSLAPVRKQLAEEVKKREAAEEIAKKEREIRRTAEFSKKAETDLPNLPGTAADKGLILKTLNDKLTEEEFGKVLQLLQAGDAAQKALTAPVGKSTPGSESAGGGAWTKIEKLAKERAAVDKVSTAVAMDRVLKEQPALYDEYLKEAGTQQ